MTYNAWHLNDNMLAKRQYFTTVFGWVFMDMVHAGDYLMGVLDAGDAHALEQAFRRKRYRTW